MLRKAAEFQLSTRVRWQIGFRCAFLLAVGVSAVVLNTFYFDPLENRLLYLLVGGLGFSFISWIALKTVKSNAIHVIAWSQIIFDMLMTAGFVELTGGLYSSFSILFVLQILIAALVMSIRGVLVTTALAVFSLIFIALVLDAGHQTYSWARLLFVSSALLFVGGSVALLFRSKERLVENLAAVEGSLADLKYIHRAIVDHIPSGIIFISPSDEIQLMNPAAKSILKLDLVGEKILATPLKPLFQLEGRRETILPVPSGEKILGHHLTQLVDGGKILVFQDVTELRELERRMHLRERLASVGQLAAGIAHEIRNPLASLSGSIQLLQRESALSDGAEKLMGIVLRETDRLDSLLQDFLNYAKPSHLNFEPVFVGQLISDLVVLLKNWPELSSGLVKVEVDCPHDIKCVGDSRQIRQILWNLVKNAVQAMPTGGTVKISVQNLNNEIAKFEVTDTGEGIPDDIRDRIFDPFFSTKNAGSGLGLSLVYQMVKAHGGKIGFQSQLGRGTKMWFEIGHLKAAASAA